MTLTPHETFEHHVLRRLAKGSDWSQRFPKLKPVIDRLQDGGHVVRHPAPGSRVPLMVSITEKGERRLRALDQKK